MKILSALLFVIFTDLTFAGPLTQSESLYQLDIELTDQTGHSTSLDVFRVQPVLIALFYARCPHVCPLTIHTIQTMESALEPAAQKQLRILLVTLDARDTPQLLSQVGTKQKVDFTRWKFARTDTASVRTLAAVLGVRYRKLPDGEFNHSTLMTLLNGDGIPVYSSSQLSQTDAGMLAAIHALLPVQ